MIDHKSETVVEEKYSAVRVTVVSFKNETKLEHSLLNSLRIQKCQLIPKTGKIVDVGLKDYPILSGSLETDQ